MNETLRCILTAAVSGALSAFVVFFCIQYGKRRTGTDSSGIEELERRAGADNRALAEAERGTREAIECAAEANRNFDRIVGEQAEDNKRAEANNRRSRELIERAEEILSHNNDK